MLSPSFSSTTHPASSLQPHYHIATAPPVQWLILAASGTESAFHELCDEAVTHSLCILILHRKHFHCSILKKRIFSLNSWLVLKVGAIKGKNVTTNKTRNCVTAPWKPHRLAELHNVLYPSLLSLCYLDITEPFPKDSDFSNIQRNGYM